MTHQVMPFDRDMANECGADFPIIVGGHDHQPYLETVNGCVITKQGADATIVGVVDLTWPTPDTPGGAPTVEVKQLPSADFAPDADCQKLVEKHKSVLKSLDFAKLCMLPESAALNSKGIRLAQTTMGTLLCTALRDSLMADCAVINAGNIRGNTLYDESKHSITYADLKSEIPFDSKVTVVPLPGRVINEVVAFTRQFALQDPPVEKGMYAQLDDGMTWSKETNAVLTIAGAPLEPEKIYRCAVLYLVAMKGIDGVEPLADWVKENAEGNPEVQTDEEAAPGAKEVLVEHFSRAVWWNVVKAAGFDEIDRDSSGTITREELSKALEEYYGHDMGHLVLDNLMSVADANGDGVIDRMELLQACFMSASMFIGADKDGDGQLTMEEVSEVLQQSLGPAYCPDMAAKLFAEADADGTGTVTVAELKSFAKKQETGLKI